MYHTIEFANNFTPQSLAAEMQRGNPINDSTVDEYIRGYLTGDPTDGYMQAHRAGQPVYSQKQLQILDQMKSYMNGNAGQ